MLAFRHILTPTGVTFIMRNWNSVIYLAEAAAFSIQVGEWANLLEKRERSAFPTYGIIVEAGIAIAFMICAVQIYRLRFRPLQNAFFLALAFSSYLLLFTAIYWTYGTRKNFSISLSHFDAFYVALGNLTTAGTGNISAISEQARAIQALQMILDFALIAIVFSLILTRYADIFGRQKSGPPQEIPLVSNAKDDRPLAIDVRERHVFRWKLIAFIATIALGFVTGRHLPGLLPSRSEGPK